MSMPKAPGDDTHDYGLWIHLAGLEDGSWRMLADGDAPTPGRQPDNNADAQSACKSRDSIGSGWT